MIGRMKTVLFFFGWLLISTLSSVASEYLLLYKVNHTDRDFEVRSVLCKAVERREGNTHAVTKEGRRMVVAAVKWHRAVIIPDYRFPEITSKQEIALFNKRLGQLDVCSKTYPTSKPYLRATIELMSKIDMKLKQGLVIHGGRWMAKEAYLAEMEAKRKDKAAAMATADKRKQQKIKEDEERARMIVAEKRKQSELMRAKEKKEHEAKSAVEFARELAEIERERKEKIETIRKEIARLQNSLEEASKNKQRKMQELKSFLKK